MGIKLSILLLVAFCALLGAFGQLFLKLGSSTLSFDFYSIITNWKLILGLFLYSIAAVLFIIALKQGNLSILYPIIATSYIWVSVLSVIFLRENFPYFKWFGVIFILLGVIIIVR